MFTFGLRWGEGFVAPAAAFEEGGTETVGQAEALRPSEDMGGAPAVCRQRA